MTLCRRNRGTSEPPPEERNITLRVAVVHDWLYTIGGAERVLAEILRCYPKADVFTLFDVLSPLDRARLGIEKVHTSFLQSMPLIRSHHRMFLPLMPFAIEQFDLSNYDLVISSSYAVAKGILTGPDQVHVSYIHSPMRYAWDMQHSYLRQNGYSGGLKGLLARVILHQIRMWDMRTANGPDEMIANSAFIQRRIRKTYGRAAHLIYPPVNQSPFDVAPPRGGHFLAASRLVHYKNIEPIVRAFGLLPDLKLMVAGDGPESSRLKGLAGSNIAFAGYVEDEELRRLMATARAFVFAAEEDFGIVPVEAMAEGTPVLALARGGVRETVVTSLRRTGMFFATPSPDDIAACVRDFVKEEHTFLPENCKAQASRFSPERFRTEFKAFVDSAMARAYSHDETLPATRAVVQSVSRPL
jgi:glycosyltransferase involved in cell wall biosynthesis